jgi:hypothetical protein
MDLLACRLQGKSPFSEERTANQRHRGTWILTKKRLDIPNCS